MPPKKGTKQRRAVPSHKPDCPDSVSRPHMANWETVARALGIPSDWRPPVSISDLLPDITSTKMFAILMFSEEPEAKQILGLLNSLHPQVRHRVTGDPDGIDYLCASLKIRSSRLAGILMEHLAELRSVKAQAKLSFAAPEIADAAIETAKIQGSEGYQDRKMILQSVGIAPMPKNQVTNLTLNNSRLTQINAAVSIPRLEDVTRAVEQAQQRAGLGEKEPMVLEAESV